jgi:uncharacterized protein
MQHPFTQIPELMLSSDSTGVIRIPTEQDVPFSPRVRSLVDCAEFQRLRHVTQLALASRVYPGATHTRFEHALGVYHNALKYLWQLGLDETFAQTVSIHDAEVLIVAALLHDIGHWPFCHPIEDMELPQMPPHESFAGTFLGPGSELTQTLQREWKISPDEVLGVLNGTPASPSARLRSSILSGPIDIDKMDYLVRDSQHCGVPYGRHFDRSRLIGSLIVNELGNGLAISTKGRTAAEMMVFARYVMFSEVYWHHAVRSATCMFARTFFEVHHNLCLDELFRMSEPDLIRAIGQAAEGTDATRLINGLFGSHRHLYKRLAEFSIYHEPEIYQAVRSMTYAQSVQLSRSLAEHVRQETGTDVSDLDLLIDAPPLHREVEFQVDVRAAHEPSWRPLREMSPIVDAMARTQFDDCVKKVRVFMHPRFDRSGSLVESVTDFLRSAVT